MRQELVYRAKSLHKSRDTVPLIYRIGENVRERQRAERSPTPILEVGYRAHFFSNVKVRNQIRGVFHTLTYHTNINCKSYHTLMYHSHINCNNYHTLMYHAYITCNNFHTLMYHNHIS
jgi:hypothetical protein